MSVVEDNQLLGRLSAASLVGIASGLYIGAIFVGNVDSVVMGLVAIIILLFSVIAFMAGEIQ